ncbi:hypothetical protein AVEN_227924-1 [Araneus ventricosus]|uniref:Uncharacterized protein n=1 Tax=Araneus ventricosus TaxID=182803 RepID=A0A4Y2LVZ5_ARAVE|nr:hypothetical protein AVEN_227924-1 [Araneus ventricosus]
MHWSQIHTPPLHCLQSFAESLRLMNRTSKKKKSLMGQDQAITDGAIQKGDTFGDNLTFGAVNIESLIRDVTPNDMLERSMGEIQGISY